MISPQDFERLSAYVDNQLPATEKAVVEQQLAQDPELRQALTEMRYTILALRALPVLKPPRNFTLSRAQVASTPRWQWFSAMRFASALAGLLFVVIVARDLLGQSAGGAASEVAKISQADITHVTEAATANDAAIQTMGAGAETPIPEVAPPQISTFMEASTATPDSTTRLATPPTLTPVAVAEYPGPTGVSIETQAYPVDSNADVFDGARSQWRAAEVGLAFLTIFLALAAWLGRKRTHTDPDELHRH